VKSFDELSTTWQLRPIRNCPGRFVLHTGPTELTPRELLESETEIAAFKVSSARDTVLVARIDGGGLISYLRADGSHLHTLNTIAGFERKLRDLGIEDKASSIGRGLGPGIVDC
jgi:hypothetical protein